MWKNKKVLYGLLIGAILMVICGISLGLILSGNSNHSDTPTTPIELTIPTEIQGIAKSILFSYLTDLISQWPMNIREGPQTKINDEYADLWRETAYEPNTQRVTVSTGSFGLWYIYIDSGQVLPMDDIARLTLSWFNRLKQ